MKRLTNKIAPYGLTAASLLVVLVLAVCIAYRVGYSKANQQAQAHQIDRENIFAKEKSQEQLEMSRMSSNYDTACYNYQTLYAAYSELYKKVGTGPGLAMIPLPDGARGNENSCYR